MTLWLSLACTSPLGADGTLQDSDTSSTSEERPSEICDDGVDNDGDGDIDCADNSCFTGVCAERCDDGIDNDGDSVADCDDPDCFWSRDQPTWLSCWEDCSTQGPDWPHAQDPSLTVCADIPQWEDCHDTQDNDWDGLVDCEDPDCADATCAEDCRDFHDNDQDGLVDCEDADCFLVCKELCDNGVDDDANLATDCEDLACVGHKACQALTIEAGVLLGGSQELSASVSGLSVYGTWYSSAAWSLQSLSGEVQVGPELCTFTDQSISWDQPISLGWPTKVGHTRLELNPECPRPAVYIVSQGVFPYGLGSDEIFHVTTVQDSENRNQRVQLYRGPSARLPVAGRLVFAPVE